VARRKDRLEALADEVGRAYGIKSVCLSADLSQMSDVSALILAIQAQGLEIDGLINNAGYSIGHRFEHTNWSQQADFIQVCVTTPTALAHAFLPAMVQRGEGHMINLASIVAFSPGAPGHTLYPAAKAYILKMSRSLAAEYGDKGIQITALCPGSTRSEFQHVNGMDQVIKSGSLPFIMSAQDVVEGAIKGNEAGHEVVVTGLVNQLAVAAMCLLPDFIITPLIRWGAKKYQLDQ